MKSFVFIILLFSILVPAQAKWVFHKQYDRTSIFKAPLGSRLVVDFSQTAVDETKKEKFNIKFLKGLEKKKAHLLTMTGVKDWQVTGRKINQLKAGNQAITELVFSGSYINRKGIKIYFLENHRYSPSSRLQILVTNKNQEKLKSDINKNSFQEIIRKYEPKK